MLAPWFGSDIKRLDKILLELTPSFSEDALQAPGTIKTRVIDMAKLEEDESQRSEREKSSNEAVTVWDYLMSRFAAIDSRIVNETGTRFSAGLKDDKKMKQPMQYGSEAMASLENVIPLMRDRLNGEFRLFCRGRHGVYHVKPFKLVSPDITGVSEINREKYKVRRYANALHADYNGLNSFEVRMADALDALGNTWCRNPVKDYGIPIAELGADTVWFYPDFLLWTDKEIWAIDPKGKHLAEAAVTQKLLDMTGIEGLDIPIRVALVLEGSYVINPQGTFSRNNKEGFTLIRRTTTGPKAVMYQNMAPMMQDLVAD